MKNNMDQHIGITTKTDVRIVFTVVVGAVSFFAIGFGFIGMLSKLIRPATVVEALPVCNTYQVSPASLGSLVDTEVALHDAQTALVAGIEAGTTGNALKTLADTRKGLLIEMMQIDLTTAKNYLLNDSDRAFLSQKTTNCSEASITATGDVVTTIIEEEDTHAVDTTLTTDGNIFHLFLTNNSILRNNQGTATISGLQIDNAVYVDSHQENAFTYTTSPEKSITYGQVGVQPLIFVKFTAPDLNDISITDDEIMDALNKANEYYMENSWGKLSFAGLQNTSAVADIKTVKSTQPVGCDIITLNRIMEQAMAAVYTGGKNPTVIVLYHFPDTCGGGYSQANIGLSTYGSKQIYPIWLSHNYFEPPRYPVSWMGKVIAHEMGHTLGNYHAGLYNHNIFTTPFDLKTCIPRAGFNIPQNGLTFDTTDEVYGDHFDIMGRYGMGHFNAYNKKSTGWQSDSSLVTVTEDGTYRLGPNEFAPDATNGPIRALQIPRTTDGKEFLYVEFRTPHGFDQDIPVPYSDTLAVHETNAFDGALLHIEYPCTTQSNMSGGDGRIIDPYDEVPGVGYVTPALLPGDSFTDPQTGVQVTVTGINKASEGNYQDAWLDVQVTYPKTPHIVAPESGSVVGGTFEFQSDFFGGTGNEEIEYFINDELVASTTDRAITVDTAAYADESTLTLKAQAKGTELASSRDVLIERCQEGENCIKAIHLYWNPSQNITMTDGTAYTVSFWAKKGTADNARIFFGGDGWTDNCWAENLTTDWTQKTCTVNVPGTPATSESVFMRILEGGGSEATDPTLFSYVDDIKVYLKGETPKDSIVLNGGFEDEGASWWMGDTYNPLVQTSPNRVCGDVNGTGNVDVADVTALVSYAFRGGTMPFPLYTANVNGIGPVDVADITYLVSYAFKGGPAPVCHTTPTYALPLGSQWNETEYTTWYNQEIQ